MRKPLLLSLLLTSAVSVAASSVQSQGVQTFTIPGSSTVTRLSSEQGSSLAAVSRDGGSTWQNLARPDFRISTQYAEFNPANGEPVVVPGLAAGAGNQLHLVQFHTPAVQEYRDALKMAGADIYSFMAYQAYLVRMDAATAAEVSGLEFVRYVGDYHPAYRLDPAIIASLAGGVPMAPARYNILTVDFFADAPALSAAIVALGGKVEMVDRLLVSATLTQAQLQAVAQENTVMWIDEWSAPEYDMDNARIQSGAEVLHNLPGAARIDGRGLRSHINEGIHTTHPEFRVNLPYRTSTPIAIINSGSNSHGTNTAGEVWAEGVNPQARGGAPFCQPYYSNSNSTYVTLFNRLMNQEGVVATTQSWDSSRVTTYTSESATRDQAVFESDIYATQSQSNAGAIPSRPGAWAKNTASVGGFNHRNNPNPADDCWCRTGSIGPASDGRIGVTFTGYYDSILTTSGSSSYTSGFGGTSGATPMVNGFSLLAIQMFSDGMFGYPGAPSWQNRVGTLPHFTTTKTMIMATTRPVNYNQAGTSNGANRYHQGWGFPHVGDLYDNRNNVLVIDEENASIDYAATGSKDVLTQGQTRTYWVYVAPATQQLRAALTWADVPGNPANQSQHRVNDFNLSVITPSGTLYRGNNGLLSGPFSTSGGEANTKDTEEMVIIPEPTPGLWTVEVFASEIVADTHVETGATDADYSLTVRGISGGRDTSGMVMDVSSTQPGEFNVSVSNVPASGWTTGYTLMSVDSTRRTGLGNLFGLEVDALAFSILGQAPSAGGVFAFTNSGNPSDYPNATFSFPVAVAAAVTGLTFDATVVLADAQGAIVGVSSVDRETIQ